MSAWRCLGREGENSFVTLDGVLGAWPLISRAQQRQCQPN
jgi:hypothetical protein